MRFSSIHTHHRVGKRYSLWKIRKLASHQLLIDASSVSRPIKASLGAAGLAMTPSTSEGELLQQISCTMNLMIKHVSPPCPLPCPRGVGALVGSEKVEPAQHKRDTCPSPRLPLSDCSEESFAIIEVLLIALPVVLRTCCQQKCLGMGLSPTDAHSSNYSIAP